MRMESSYFACFALAAVIALLPVSCGNHSSMVEDRVAAGAHDPHGGHEDEEENHDHGGGDLRMSPEEIIVAECEHGIKAIDCASCRFEVGVVRIDPDLMSGDGTGRLIRLQKFGDERIDPFIETTGKVEVNEDLTVHVRSRLTGIIRKAHVDFGSFVSEGDPLVTIDSIELGEAVTDLLKARSNMLFAKQTFDREKSLRAKKISSERELQEARSEFEKAKVEFESAERKLRLLGLTESDIEGLAVGTASESHLITIYAPQKGVVIEKHAVRGELVTPETELFTITDVGSFWVWADIYERDLAPLIKARSRGRVEASVEVQAFDDRSFHGELDYIAAVTDETTRTVKVRIRIENEDSLLRAGMFCDIHIYTWGGGDVPALPCEAILVDEGRSFVFKRLDGDYFFRRPVETGSRFGDLVEVRSGITPGDEVVVGGSFLLKSDVLRAKMGAGCAD